MAKLEVAGRAFELAPYRLGSLRKAAAYVDRINARGDLESLEAMCESARDMCEVLAIGLQKIDPDLDADWLEDQFGMDDILSIQAVFKEQLADSGLIPKGEALAALAQAHAEAAGTEALESSSDVSSPSSQPPE